MLRNHGLLAVGEDATALAQPLPDQNDGFVGAREPAAAPSGFAWNTDHRLASAGKRAVNEFGHPLHRDTGRVAFGPNALGGTVVPSEPHPKGVCLPARHWDTDDNQPNIGGGILEEAQH